MDPPDRPPRSGLRRLLPGHLGLIGVLVVVGYVAAILGVVLGLVGEPSRPGDPLTAAGIALLFVAFLAMFQASRMVAGTERE